MLTTRGGFEDTRLEAKDTKKSEAKAKDSLSEDRHSRGQGQERSRPRTKDTSASALQKKKKKKRSSQKFFRRSLKKKKVFTKIFQAISTKKRFPKNFSSAPQNFNNSKNSAVLKPRRLQNVPSRTPPLLTTTLCSLQQYCHKMSYLNQMYEKKAMARAWTYAWLASTVRNPSTNRPLVQWLEGERVHHYTTQLAAMQLQNVVFKPNVWEKGNRGLRLNTALYVTFAWLASTTVFSWIWRFYLFIFLSQDSVGRQ